MIKITSVTPEKSYLLRLTFSDGKTGVFNAEPYLNKGIFTELKDPALFKSVKIGEGDTIEWSNGADLCPGCVYAATFSSSQ